MQTTTEPLISCNIYAVELADNHFLVHPSVKSEECDIIRECAILYDWRASMNRYLFVNLSIYTKIHRLPLIILLKNTCKYMVLTMCAAVVILKMN